VCSTGSSHLACCAPRDEINTPASIKLSSTYAIHILQQLPGPSAAVGVALELQQLLDSPKRCLDICCSVAAAQLLLLRLSQLAGGRQLCVHFSAQRMHLQQQVYDTWQLIDSELLQQVRT
jgi:hypothetical protein